MHDVVQEVKAMTQEDVRRACPTDMYVREAV